MCSLLVIIMTTVPDGSNLRKKGCMLVHHFKRSQSIPEGKALWWGCIVGFVYIFVDQEAKKATGIRALV